MAEVRISWEVSSALMAEVSPRPVGAASQSPPRPSRPIMFLQVAKLTSRCLLMTQMLYAIVGGGLEGANCIQFHTRILLPENRRRMHWRNIQR